MKKKTRTRLGSILLTMAMILSLLPMTALADGDEGSTAEPMTLQEFVDAVTGKNGTYDGNGVVVEITPESGCNRTSSKGHNDHAAKTPNTPDRIQVYSGTSYAQYQRFEDLTDISISNVIFRLIAPESTIYVCHPWDKDVRAVVSPDMLDAELQLESSGTVSFTGCTFENVAVSPISSKSSVSFDNCHFSGLAQYGIKDVQAATISITECTFDDCSGGVYMNGAGTTSTTYTDNMFTDIGERGAIQFSATGDYSSAQISITGNSFTGKSGDNDAGFLRQLNYTLPQEAISQVTQTNTIPADKVLTTDSLGENDQLPPEINFTDNNTVYDGNQYYETMAAALTNVHQTGPRTLWCKPGANLGTLSHGHVCYDLTVYGNGAYISDGGDQDFELDTYDANGQVGSDLSKDVNLTVYHLNNVAVWGQRNSAYTLNIYLEGCENLNRVYISGTSGSNNITLKDCTFDGTASGGAQASSCTVYSNAPGNILVDNCTFTGVKEPINLNNKGAVGTTQTVNVTNCTFTNCSTTDICTDDATWAAPIRILSSEGAVSNLTMDSSNFVYDSNKTTCNGDILLGDGREGADKTSYPVYAKISNTDAEVQIQNPGDRTSSSNNAQKISVTSSAGATYLTNAVAQIGDKDYTSLDDAISAANDNDTIRILQDVQLTSTISVKKILTFEGVTKSDGTKPVISNSNGDGIISQSGDAVYTLKNLELQATKNGQWYVYHNANTLTIENCDFTMADGVTNTGNVVMGEADPADRALIFRNNTITANSRAALTGVGNGSQITGNTIDLLNEKHGDSESRTSMIAVTAKAGGAGVTITGNTFKNANRAIAVDNSTLEADKITIRDNKFINVRYAFELSPEENKDCGTYDLNENYFEFNGTVSEPKIENADASGSHFEYGDGSNEYQPVGTSQVQNNEYYLDPSMDEEDLNTYVPPTPDTPSYDSGSSEPSGDYIVSVDRVSGGKVTVNPGRADKGDEVTVTVKPSDGYELDELVVTDSKGNELKLSYEGSGKFTFTMPSGTVDVKATFVKADAGSVLDDFTDVNPDAWYAQAVEFVVEEGLMTGTSATTFAPDTSMSRAMIWTVLAAYNSYNTSGGNPWYAPGQQWAMVNGVSDGTTPNGSITREQLAVMLWRAAGSPETSESLSGYADASSVSDWAVEALAWAVNNGIISGMGGSTLAPQATATRAQVAVMLMQFVDYMEA